MEINIMLNALSDAYRLALIEKSTALQELKKCQEEIKILKAALSERSTAVPSEQAEASSTSNNELSESVKKCATTAVEGGRARRGTETPETA